MLFWLSVILLFSMWIASIGFGGSWHKLAVVSAGILAELLGRALALLLSFSYSVFCPDFVAAHMTNKLVWRESGELVRTGETECQNNGKLSFS